MATIEKNRRIWNEWKETGDEWAAAWGGTDMEWYFTILSRIHAFVPTETILEIAPGHGRWTRFLAPLCKKLVLVDLSEECIKICKETFKTCSHITYHVNDGKSLDMIPDDSIDFVFTFDSLVHAEEDVIEASCNQLAKKLKKNGIGFIHHSNIGHYKFHFYLSQKIPQCIIKNILIKLGIVEPGDHLRAYSMTANKFRHYAERAGLQCISQEMFNWGETKRLIDCISVFTRKGSSKMRQSRIVSNKNFMREVNHIRYLSDLYGERQLKW